MREGQFKFADAVKGFFIDRRVIARYRRGLAKAKRHDWAGAIEDYSAAIHSAKKQPAITAMACFNRALAYAHQGLRVQAERDLRAVLALPDTPVFMKAAATEKLARWEKRRG